MKLFILINIVNYSKTQRKTLSLRYPEIMMASLCVPTQSMHTHTYTKIIMLRIEKAQALESLPGFE